MIGGAVSDPLQYVAGEQAAAAVLSNIAADASVPNEIYLALARLETDSARIGFCRAIQKRIERTREA
jgi:thiamine monophosphate kinase